VSIESHRIFVLLRAAETIPKLEKEIADLRELLDVTKKRKTSKVAADNKLRKAKNKAEMDVRNYIEQRILADQFTICRGSYHGGSYNGVQSRGIMEDGDAITASIQEYLIEFEHPDDPDGVDGNPLMKKKATGSEIIDVCNRFKTILQLLDAIFAVLRMNHGEPKEWHFELLKNAIEELHKHWTAWGLSETPKYHFLKSHAFRQMMRIFGFGCMLEDDLEKSHQDCFKVQQRLARLNSDLKKEQNFSRSEVVSNDPSIQKAKEEIKNRTSRKRNNPDEPSKTQKKEKEQKLARHDTRTINVAALMEKPAPEPYDAVTKSREDNRNASSR